ncbi:MAG: hypothetical protein AB1Z22_06405, partial [Synechococcaceae cyanobacterium]
MALRPLHPGIPKTLALLAALAAGSAGPATAAERSSGLNLDDLNQYAAAALTSDEQVTSISQFPDVRPTDWAYQALSNLIERYG